jgi:hypothetical protein
MTTLIWLVTIALLALSPQFRIVADKRESDGERYVTVCAYVRLRPATMACLEWP